jgi:methylated-DNA-[protein]-cysteine S-methyltransferase
MNPTITVDSRRTPVGVVRLAVREDGALVALAFDEHWPALLRRLERQAGRFAAPSAAGARAVGEELDAYFAGDLPALDRIAVDGGGTPFQLRVWSELRRIRPGATRSYGEVARAIGAPSAVRAVGAANGANPIAIVVPCHRVVAADGSLHGYGGGLERKRWLLEHEARWSARRRTSVNESALWRACGLRA